MYVRRIVIPAFLSTLVLLKGMESGRYLVLLPVISAFLTDAGAYFVGVFFGKHKGITRVSPNKSLRAMPAASCSGAVHAALRSHFASVRRDRSEFPSDGGLRARGKRHYRAGDLSFSHQASVWDQGLWKCDPWPWRMLDRFDSMTFAAPALWLMVTLFPAF